MATVDGPEGLILYTFLRSPLPDRVLSARKKIGKISIVLGHVGVTTSVLVRVVVDCVCGCCD